MAIVGFRTSRSANQAAIDAAKAATDKTVNAARDTNQATIDAAHADVRRTLDATRDGQIADRYTKAIEQLGSSTIDVTIGGIYALERIALDSPRDHPTVMEVLSACIREHSREPWTTPDPEGTMQVRSTRPDIQAALTVIGRRDTKHDIRPIDLGRADLTRADLSHGALSNANLRDTNLTGARLWSADLVGAHLQDANLTCADLRMADLTEADLADADLTNALLSSAHVTGARLSRPLATSAARGRLAPRGKFRGRPGRLQPG